MLALVNAAFDTCVTSTMATTHVDSDTFYVPSIADVAPVTCEEDEESEVDDSSDGAVAAASETVSIEKVQTERHDDAAGLAALPTTSMADETKGDSNGLVLLVVIIGAAGTVLLILALLYRRGRDANAARWNSTFV